MARRKTPSALAEVSGASLKNPKRHRRGKASAMDLPALGAPSDWLSADQRSAWGALQAEFPWLCEADSALVEIASMLRARIGGSEPMGVSALNQLRLCVTMMGGSPADRLKISIPEPPDDDPTDKLFH